MSTKEQEDFAVAYARFESERIEIEKRKALKENVPPRLTADDRKRQVKLVVEGIHQEILRILPADVAILALARSDEGIYIALNKTFLINELVSNNANPFMPVDRDIKRFYNATIIVRYGELTDKLKGELICKLQGNRCPIVVIKGTGSLRDVLNDGVFYYEQKDES